jgi:N-dimethylarginine dimethylaminohydrolase
MSTVFSPLREKLYAGCLKLFAETTEHFVHARFQLIVLRKTTSSECILQGAKKIEV